MQEVDLSQNIVFKMLEHVILFFSAELLKENSSDEDMTEMIAYEVKDLSNQLKELEEKLKVFCLLNWKLLLLL